MDPRPTDPRAPFPPEGGVDGAYLAQALLKAMDEGLDPVFAALPTGRLCYVNQATCRKLGRDREALLAMNLRELAPAETEERWAAFWDSSRSGDQATLETSLLARDGAVLPVELAGACRPHGDLEVLFGNIRDLSARRTAEEALRSSENLFRDLLESQGEGFGTTDPEEHFIYANPVAEEIFGVGPGELEGRSLKDFLGEDEIRQVAKETAIRSRGAQSSYAMRIRRPSGEVRTIQVTATPKTGREGRFQGTIGVFRDITETLVLEEALRQSQKLESLGLLAGGIAHDFNNLLTAIMANLNLAQDGLHESSAEARFLANAEKTVLRAADLTKQMLAYSGKGQFLVKPQDLNLVVREILELVNVSIPKNVSLRFHLGRDLPPVMADAAQVQQVIMNLVTNASEAIGDREGLVIVGTRTLDLGEDAAPLVVPHQGIRPGRYVVLDVSDTGCGMSGEVQARIFDPFFTTKPTGRGLGLSAMLGILRGHGGGIKLRSEEGKGSTFELFFPAYGGEVPPPLPGSEPHATAFSGRILLVDDEQVVLEATGAALESLGFEVLKAVDGRQALERFEAEAGTLRLVLMDVTMPRLDGRKAFQAMHASRPDIPVVLSSGYDKEMSTEGFSSLGLAGFLQKPYRIPDLRRALAQALERRV